MCPRAGEVKEVKASDKGEDVHEPPMRRKKERLDTPMQGSDEWVWSLDGMSLPVLGPSRLLLADLGDAPNVPETGGYGSPCPEALSFGPVSWKGRKEGSNVTDESFRYRPNDPTDEDMRRGRVRDYIPLLDVPMLWRLDERSKEEGGKYSSRCVVLRSTATDYD